MIVSRLRRLRFEKEEREGVKLTYEKLTEETGLASSTLSRLLKPGAIDRVDGSTLDTLCRYFSCGVGDVLEYVPASYDLILSPVFMIEARKGIQQAAEQFAQGADIAKAYEFTWNGEERPLSAFFRNEAQKHGLYSTLVRAGKRSTDNHVPYVLLVAGRTDLTADEVRSVVPGFEGLAE